MSVTVREVADETVVLLVSDLHIGGSSGDEIFASAAELTAFLTSWSEATEPVELVILGDFLDLQRLGPSGQGGQSATATLARPEYAALFQAFRDFRRGAGHRVVYVVGNHDAETWWNPDVGRVLSAEGIVDEVALSYAAQYSSLPGRVVYGEHGNQFDPSNAITNYADPLDSPIGEHVVEDIIRPIGATAPLTKGLDLREINFVFPLASIGEWLTGRLFYRFLTEVTYWLIAPFLAITAINLVISAVVSQDSPLRTVDHLLTQVSFNALLLLVALGAVFVAARRTAFRAVESLTPRFGGRRTEPQRIHDLLVSDQSPPQGAEVTAADVAVFATGHTHAPSMTSMTRADGSAVAVVNPGCWLRQLHPVRARWHAPSVYVPVFVQSHVEISRTPDGLSVQLWNRPKPTTRSLPWLERLAILGRSRRGAVSTQPVMVKRCDL